MKKESLLLFHGWNRDNNSYRRLRKTAPENWDIYSVDPDNLHKSGWIDQLGENVTRFLDQNGLEKVNIVGHSIGGALALSYARLHPERVERLFLLDASGVYGGEPLSEVAFKLLKSHFKNLSRGQSESLKATWRALKRPFSSLKLAIWAHKIDLQKEAEEVNVPTIIIWGENDNLNPLWQGKRLHELIKDSKLIVLPKAVHDWPLYAPELFWKNV